MQGQMVEERAQFAFAAEERDPLALAERSAALWAGLGLDDEAHAALRRDGLAPAGLRLSGAHPFVFGAAPDGAIAVSAHAADTATAEARLDLFRVYFLRRLLA